MKIPLKIRLFAGVLFAAAIVLSLCILFFYNSGESRGAEQWTHHTLQVIDKLQNISLHIKDQALDSDKLSQKDAYVREAAIHNEVEVLNTLIHDNKPQVKRSARLSAAIDSLSVCLYNGTALLKDGQNESGHVKKHDLLAAVDAILRDMIATEYSLLEVRMARAAAQRNISTWTNIAGTAIILFLIGFLCTRVYAEFNKRSVMQDKLKHTIRQSDRLMKETKEKNALLTGLATLNEDFQSVNDTDTFAKRVLYSIIQILELPAGAFYIFEEREKKALQLKASSGFEAQSVKLYALEGLISSQAVDQRKLKIIKQVPANYWRFSNAQDVSGSMEIACIPLFIQNELAGVIELVSFSSFNSYQLNFFEVMVHNIAAGLNSVQAKEKENALLGRLKEHQQLLISQQEELKQTNEELTQQAMALQSSEEELKAQDEELRNINVELEEKNEALELSRQALSVKADELEQSGKFKSTFLANMSHELRTPLNSILILSRLLEENKENNLADKQVNYARIIQKSGKDLLSLINDILDLSKIEAGKMEIVTEETSLADILTSMRDTFSVIAEEKHISFSTVITRQCPASIVTDKSKLEQVLKNLLSNAFKFTDKNGVVSLSFDYKQNKDTDGKVIIKVEDNGVGISKEKQSLIFEAFTQADSSINRKFGGTGLGLSISKELVWLLGGTISMNSEKGTGSAFLIELPVNPVSEQSSNPGRIQHSDVNFKPGHSARNGMSRTKKSLLIIEDDRDFATVLSEYASSKNYETVIASNGEEGLSVARKQRPDAIILDMNMPVKNGWDTLKELNSDENLKDIPVHIISGADVDGVPGNSVITYLKKPVANESLDEAFALLGMKLQTEAKHVLIYSDRSLADNNFSDALNNVHFHIVPDYVFSIKEAMHKAVTTKYDCIIADIRNDVAESVNTLADLKKQDAFAGTPVIIYLDDNGIAFDELTLKKIADVTIVHSTQAHRRLIDELELFLNRFENETAANSTVGAPDYLPDSSLKNKKALVADDDIRNVFALNVLLEEQGMTVVTAANGREALEMLTESKDIDIILMDVMMPEVDGLEAIARLRKMLLYKETPVIALTAKAMMEDREQCIKAGASDYLSKPFEASKLLSLMRVWLSRK
ncbi:response regulator [Danxiaibacter flavus]|uniref:histidine kinase n=1 Tax=Danxiaibacter flavus TaxID=3049108 RepID=A0ABV3ZDC6_9BACT|nr:response regulator [Chitinophagaceae bacterium DXS]